MSLFNELSYDNAITGIRSVQFSLLSPEDIKKRSVVEVLTTDSFVGNEPVTGGLFDQRMGVVDHTHRCLTCQQDFAFCPGHIGHISLAVPVYQVHFFTAVLKILKCVCFACSRLLAAPDNPAYGLADLAKLSNKRRHEECVHRISKSTCLKRCGQCNPEGCGALLPVSVVKDPERFMKIVMTWPPEAGSTAEPKKLRIGAKEAWEILRRITDADSAALGFNPKLSRPEWLVATVLPVCPPPVRPSSKNEMGQRSEDDITTVLCQIIKNNNLIKAKLAAGKELDANDPTLQLLQSCTNQRAPTSKIP